MKSVTLIEQRDPERRIQAIKAIRVATGLGLRDSKDIADNLIGFSRAGGRVRIPATQQISVYDDASIDDLRNEFVVVEAVPSDALGVPNGVPRDSVIALLIEAIGRMSVEDSFDFANTKAYQLVQDSLGLIR